MVNENPMTNFLADGFKNRIKCDLIIVNSRILNGGINKGKVHNMSKLSGYVDIENNEIV